MTHRYPDLTLPYERRYLGLYQGQAKDCFFELPTPNDTAKTWLWIDEKVNNNNELLEDFHSPHEYSGYDLHVRKQPVITKFTHHDHIIIPDLDCETEGEQTLSIIVYPDLIWTRRSQHIKGIDELFASTDFKARAHQHQTTAYIFVGILRVMLEGLNTQLLRNEHRTYALEDLFLQRKDRKKTPQTLDDTLKEMAHLPNAKKLVELRIHIAWLRKQFEAFERLTNALLDPTQGAFHHIQPNILQQEALPYFQHLADQVHRASTKIQHLRDIHFSLEQLLAAQQAERTNQTLLKLTWVSMIFLPTVVIAGIFGMNISIFTDPRHVWGSDSKLAFGLLIGAVMVGSIAYVLQQKRYHKS